MKFPATSDELKRKGYEYDNEATCRRCGERIEWWIDPSGRKSPMSILPPQNVLKNNEEKRRPHFVDCRLSA
jgi:hypothetical protein